MLAIPEKNASIRPGGSPLASWFKLPSTLEEAGRDYLNWSLNQVPAASADQALIPIKTPLVFSGFSARAFNNYKSFFSRDNFQPVLGAKMAASQALNLNVPPRTTLNEARRLVFS
jgi:hypothetical protein